MMMHLGVHTEKGTAMKKPAKEPAQTQASLWTQLLIPLAAVVRGDLLALVHQLGMQAVAAMLEAERTKLCGERYKHDASRRATRVSTARGELAEVVAFDGRHRRPVDDVRRVLMAHDALVGSGDRLLAAAQSSRPRRRRRVTRDAAGTASTDASFAVAVLAGGTGLPASDSLALASGTALVVAGDEAREHPSKNVRTTIRRERMVYAYLISGDSGPSIHPLASTPPAWPGFRRLCFAPISRLEC